MNWKILFILSLFVNLMLFFAFISYNLDLDKNELYIQNLTQKNQELENKIDLLQSQINNFTRFFKNNSEKVDSELRDPSWDELKMFLEADDTNRLLYNDSFVCSGFAIELFKRARSNGLRCGIVEIEETNNIGHMLNVFNTTDKGLVFVDVTGNEQGTANDKIAYIEIGKPYGTIELDKVKENLISCDVDCKDLISKVQYTYYPNIFEYNYYLKFKKCKDFYENCINIYNQNIEEFNKGKRKYTYSELNSWSNNLGLLEDQITSNNFYVIVESDPVKNIQLYW